MNNLSHIDSKKQPTMVDVGGKPITRRVARARAIVILPRPVLAALKRAEIHTPKGPVFQTARLAGIMAAKQTASLIPLCHPLPLEDCRVEIALRRRREVVIECRAATHHKTGVEMEAMTGAAVAALTVYDMCKGLSREFEIRAIVLLEKTGGRHDYRRRAAAVK